MNIMEILSHVLLESWKAIYYTINSKALPKKEEIVSPPHPDWREQYTDKADHDNETLK